jgi:hypothetical protein
MKCRLLLVASLLFVFCTDDDEPTVDDALYGTWLASGMEEVAEGRVVHSEGYSVENALVAYRIDEQSLSQFVQGENHQGFIEYYDSVKVKTYAVTIDPSTISSSEMVPLTYSLRSECCRVADYLIKTSRVVSA